MPDRRKPLNARPLGGRGTTLSPIDTLTLFAEVSVALAGFSGVIVALRGHRPGEDTLAYGRLFRLLEASLACALFSALPQVLLHTGLSNSGSWRVSAACLVVYMLVAQAYLMRRFWSRNVAPPPGSSFLAVGLLSAGQLVFAVGLAFGLFGHVPIVGTYLAALLFLLVVAGSMFARLVLQGDVGAAFHKGESVKSSSSDEAGGE